MDPSLLLWFCLCLIRCGESNVELSGLKRCSKIAIIKNMDMSIAVATNPKEIAFIDVEDLHGPSLSPSLPLYMLHELDSFMFFPLWHASFELFSRLLQIVLLPLFFFFWVKNRGNENGTEESFTREKQKTQSSGSRIKTQVLKIIIRNSMIL